MTTYSVETYCPKCEHSWETNIHFPDDEKKNFQIVETICEKCGIKQRFEVIKVIEVRVMRNTDPEII